MHSLSTKIGLLTQLGTLHLPNNFIQDTLPENLSAARIESLWQLVWNGHEESDDNITASGACCWCGGGIISQQHGILGKCRFVLMMRTWSVSTEIHLNIWDMISDFAASCPVIDSITSKVSEGFTIMIQEIYIYIYIYI